MALRMARRLGWWCAVARPFAPSAEPGQPRPTPRRSGRCRRIECSIVRVPLARISALSRKTATFQTPSKHSPLSGLTHAGKPPGAETVLWQVPYRLHDRRTATLTWRCSAFCTARELNRLRSKRLALAWTLRLMSRCPLLVDCPASVSRGEPSDKGQRVLPLIGGLLPLIGGLSVTPFCSSPP